MTQEIDLPPLPTRMALWRRDATLHLDPAFRDPLWRDTDIFTADQMRSYATQAVMQERERCAKVCDGIAESHGPRDKWTSEIAWEDQVLGSIDGAELCAAAIRRG